jgi:predicted small lipoprotein YifL
LSATISRTAVIAALAAGLALAGCGRKGALEAPPSARASAPAATGQPTLGEPEHSALESERRSGGERDPASQKKSFPLDFLITGPTEQAHERARERRTKDAQQRAKEEQRAREQQSEETLQR